MLRSTRGIALIAVLWVTALLAVMAAGFTSSSRTEARLAFNHLEAAKAEALADGGVQHAVRHLLEFQGETAWRASAIYNFPLGDGEVQVVIEDEDGKIDLNVAPLELLAGLFRALSLDDEQALAMADRIGDFRDEDSDAEPFGAEDQAYRQAGLGEGPADRPFITESELLHVLGMTQEWYQRVRPFVTVYSGAEGIDPMRAPRSVLEALPGMTPEATETLLTAGPEVDPFDVFDDQSLLEAEIYLLPSRELVYTIRALGRSAGGGTFVREAVIELTASPDQPFLVYTWRRGRLSRDEKGAPDHRNPAGAL